MGPSPQAGTPPIRATPRLRSVGARLEHRLAMERGSCRVDFYDTVRQRRMVRNFTDATVDESSLARVLDAARRGPSAGKVQGLDLVVLVGTEETQRYWSVTLPDPLGFRWQGLLRAPVLVVPVVDPGAYAARYAEPDKAATGLGS